MTFKEDVADLARRAISAQAVAQTEEATKNAIVMPFLRVLGFDVFDPMQVIPEFIADVGLKKGEKIDYAVKIGDRIDTLLRQSRSRPICATRSSASCFVTSTLATQT